VRTALFVRFHSIKRSFLPRQARDKHRESTQKTVLSQHLGPTFEHRRDGAVEQLITCVDEIDEDAAVPCVLEPVGVVFFCYGVVHGTGINLSGAERSGVAYHFVRHLFIKMIILPRQAQARDKHRENTQQTDAS
jgi:ectoine hydroxylase-related dioxygenase (phytanoyl-CoA dioxygenase family)